MRPATNLRQSVVFRLEEQRCALHLSQVERVVPMVAVSPLPKAPAVAIGVINYHGSVVPVLDLRPLFGFPSRECRLSDHLLLARTTRRMLALPVDEVLGVGEVRVEDIPPASTLPGVGDVAGIVAVSDGLLFIHDLGALLSVDDERQLSEALNEAKVYE